MQPSKRITQLINFLKKQPYYPQGRDASDALTPTNTETFLKNQVERFAEPKSKLVTIYNKIAEKIKEKIKEKIHEIPEVDSKEITIFKTQEDKLDVLSWLDKLIKNTYPSNLKSNSIIKAFEKLSNLTGLSFPFQTGFAGELRVELALNSLKDSNEIEEIITTPNNKSISKILDIIDNKKNWIKSMINRNQNEKQVIRNHNFTLDFLGIDFLIQLKEKNGTKQYIPIQVKQSANAVNRFYNKVKKITFDSPKKIKQLLQLLDRKEKVSNENTLKFQRQSSIPCISLENKSITDLQKSLRQIINDPNTKKLVLKEAFDENKYKSEQDYNFALSAEFFNQGFLSAHNIYCAA